LIDAAVSLAVLFGALIIDLRDISRAAMRAIRSTGKCVVTIMQ
jgi:hypothetical protein